ncbi:MAG: malonyl-CoA synthase [Gammaproteobacteria bacterium]|nr:malonyl-CoA synthase [Gammaproteobacteria bacterium]
MANPLWDAIAAGQPNPEHTLVKFADETTLTAAEFFSLSAQLAHVLTHCGVQPGDRVAVQVPKSIEALALYIACVRSGAVFLPLNTAYTSAELEYFIGDATPSLLVMNPADAEQGKSLAESVDAEIHTLGDNHNGSLMDLAEKQSTEYKTVDRDATDLAAILYTSGTTGRSKGAMLSQHNLLSNTLSLVEAWQFTESDVLLHALPIFHTHGLFVASNTVFISGASMLFVPKFDIDEMITLLPKVTSLMGVPTFYTRLLNDKRFTKDLASNMRLFISGSAPLLAETHVEFEERTGHRILERYGMTETNMNTSNPYEGSRIAGTVGVALPQVQIRIMNSETSEPCPVGEVGMLEVKGPNVFSGYWKMPEKTKEEFTDDGFFITGDLAMMDENNYVTIVGRGKDLIITGGFNVYPKEIELVLDECEGVVESAVVGAKHPDFGEAVVAFVVDGHSSNQPEPYAVNPEFEANLIQQANDKLAKFKQPKRILFVSELPRNTMGKVQKNELRQRTESLFNH